MDLVLAKVTQVSPLLVLLDGATVPTTAIPISVFTPAVNQRVVVTRQGTALMVIGPLGGGSVASSGATSTQMAVLRANHILTGGGIVLAEAAHLRWTSPLTFYGAGKGAHFAAGAGGYDFSVPPAGTSIPGSGGASARTVTAAGYIPLDLWDTLWAIPNLAGTYSDYTYHVTRYSSALVVPDHWIFIAFRNGYDGRIKLGNGLTYDYWRDVTGFLGTWTSHGTANRPQYQKSPAGMVIMRGIAVNGGSGAMFNLPAGYRIGRYQRFATTPGPGGAAARIDVDTGGTFYYAFGNQSEMNIDNITYLAEN